MKIRYVLIIVIAVIMIFVGNHVVFAQVESDAAAPTPILPGEVTVSASASLTYIIR